VVDKEMRETKKMREKQRKERTKTSLKKKARY
jgi:hypothetical protein